MTSSLRLVRYAPAGFILYDRLHAATRSKGSTAFLIYTSDVLGQLAACSVVAYREFDLKATHMEELDFFRTSIYYVVVFSLCG